MARLTLLLLLFPFRVVTVNLWLNSHKENQTFFSLENPFSWEILWLSSKACYRDCELLLNVPSLLNQSHVHLFKESLVWKKMKAGTFISPISRSEIENSFLFQSTEKKVMVHFSPTVQGRLSSLFLDLSLLAHSKKDDW